MLLVTKKTHKGIPDFRGELVPIEFKDIPFTPKRVFVVKNVPVGTSRGGHAHHKTKQYLLCLKGSILVRQHTGSEEITVLLNENEAVLVESLVWDSQEFLTGEDVLLVFCNTPYSAEDYIRDFREFKKILSKGRPV